MSMVEWATEEEYKEHLIQSLGLLKNLSVSMHPKWKTRDNLPYYQLVDMDTGKIIFASTDLIEVEKMRENYQWR